MHALRTAFPLVALVLFALAATSTAAHAQLSPGPLARAHATLEGSTNCVQCHGLRKEPMTQRCLACHKEVAWLMQQNRGLHAGVRNVPHRECASCHPDHAGADFALIDWGKPGLAQFDHARTGWALEGRHRTVKCADCHAASFRHSPAAALSPRVHGAGWMGLEQGCNSCHERDDVHKGSLGRSCDRCHDAADWKKPVRFDHEKTSYPLTGKHADVACDRCHKAAKLGLRPDAKGRVIGLYKPLPAAQCSACHADPHKGRLSARCSTCHSTRDFKEVDRKEFDHAATRYPLQGRHRAVACEGCHGANLARKTPAFARCADCHADAHFGRGTLAGQAVDCAACHRVDGFAPSTYTVAQHAGTGYPLVGRHAEVRCALCHTATDSLVRAAPRQLLRRVTLRPKAVSCESCHADAHRGDVAGGEGQRRCTSCHDERGWSPSTFTAARHAALSFALDGAHLGAACSTCHVPARPASPLLPNGRRAVATVPLRIDGACESCHVDPHAGRYSRGAPHAGPDGCRTCHDTRRFAPSLVTAARHAAYGFALEGAHRAVACRECHRELGAAPARQTLKATAPAAAARLRFDAPRRDRCAACHVDPHGAQFAGRPGAGACESCHDAARWAGAARFVHDRDSSFPLAGAHSRVPCVACHKAVAQSGGGTRVQYRPLPTACEGCHTDATLRKRP